MVRGAKGKDRKDGGKIAFRTAPATHELNQLLAVGMHSLYMHCRSVNATLVLHDQPSAQRQSFQLAGKDASTMVQASP